MSKFASAVGQSHSCFQYTDQLNQIALPLFKHTEINVFEFSRYYTDGYCFLFNTLTPALTEAYLVSDLCPTLTELQSHYIHSRFVYIDQDFIRANLINDTQKWKANIELAEQFNIDERFYILEKSPDYFDIFGFYGSIGKKLTLAYYIQIAGLLESFIKYFYQAAHDIIKDCAKSRLQLPSHYLLDQTINSNQLLQEILLTPTQNSSLILESVRITPAEARCLDLLHQGCTMKEAARVLAISPRTVEQHLVNIKIKLNCKNTKKLIALYSATKQ